MIQFDPFRPPSEEEILFKLKKVNMYAAICGLLLQFIFYAIFPYSSSVL